MVKCSTFETDSIETVLTGDWHVGNKNADKSELVKMFNYIKESGCNWICTGDVCESTGHTNKNWDARTVDRNLLSVGEQYAWVKKHLKPIASQCAGIVSGNHDERNARFSEIDPLQDLCNDLGIPTLDDAAYVNIKYRRHENRNTLIFLVHGFTSSRMRGGRVNSVEKLAHAHKADVYAVGHTHDTWHTTSIIDTMTSKGNYATKPVHFCSTGTFLKTYVPNCRSYAEKKGYDPLACGYLILNYVTSSRQVKVSEVIV